MARFSIVETIPPHGALSCWFFALISLAWYYQYYTGNDLLIKRFFYEKVEPSVSEIFHDDLIYVYAGSTMGTINQWECYRKGNQYNNYLNYRMVYIAMGVGSRCSSVHHHFSGPFTRQFLNLQHRVQNYSYQRNIAGIALQAGVKPVCIFLFKRRSFNSLSGIIRVNRKISYRKRIYQWPAVHPYFVDQVLRQFSLSSRPTTPGWLFCNCSTVVVSCAEANNETTRSSKSNFHVPFF